MGKTKLNIPMVAALILLLMTMISVHMTSGLYARYTTSASGTDSARVAKFDVDSAVSRNDDGTYTLTVTNKSEVAVEYSIVVEMNDHWSVTVDGEKMTPATGTASVTFENDSWILAPDSAPDTLLLTFEVANWRGLTKPQKESGAAEEVQLNFQVKVIAEQVD